jgi:hypothetical protein
MVGVEDFLDEVNGQIEIREKILDNYEALTGLKVSMDMGTSYGVIIKTKQPFISALEKLIRRVTNWALISGLRFVLESDKAIVESLEVFNKGEILDSTAPQWVLKMEIAELLSNKMVEMEKFNIEILRKVLKLAETIWNEVLEKQLNDLKQEKK